MSIQIAILKVLASHGNGRATLDSLKRDIALLTASGSDWNARLKRLAGRVPSIDVFGCRYVIRHSDGWEITAEGRDFLRTLEAVTQDNRAAQTGQSSQPASDAAESPPGRLIVVGHRFKSRRQRRQVAALAASLTLPGSGVREESISKLK